MKYIRTRNSDGKTEEVTIDYVIDKTEGCGFWEPGSVLQMLADGLEVWTPFEIFRAEK